MIKRYRDMLDAGKQSVSPVLSNFKSKFAVDWAPFLNSKWTDAADTQIPLSEIQRLGRTRHRAARGVQAAPLRWRVSSRRASRWPRQPAGRLGDGGNARVRLAALERLRRKALGTGLRARHLCAPARRFARPGARALGRGSYTPLQHIGKDQGDFVVIDSVLSEEAVLGFEYGFSTAEPNALVVWEAQFGDFANGAQVVMDQFISSGETKWGRVCGLVQLLPHGYEGQGPEHSSARLERYLQLCAEHNMQVCVPTNAAQIFHLLRRQMLRPFRKPLVVMSPKSLLRKKEAASPIQELASGSFQTVIPDTTTTEEKDVKRIVACCGKVYYDLATKRIEMQEATSPSSASSNSIRFRTSNSRPRSSATRTQAKWCGARRSRRTRAPGIKPRTSCAKTCATTRSCTMQAGRPPRRRREAIRRATTKDRRLLWNRHSANSSENIL